MRYLSWMIQKLFKLILVILWMSVIFGFSNQKAEDSSKLSNGVIVKIARIFVDKDLSIEKQEELLEKYTGLVRKTAHFGIYLILGVLVINFLIEFNIKHIIILSLMVCMLYSASDEIHQLFVPGRSGEVRDVLIDSSGALGGIGLYKLFMNKIKLKHK